MTKDDQLLDEYHLPIGIRTVKVVGTEFLINDKPFYFKGFGKHEDSHIHGRGYDEALNVRDLNLMKWIGANSFRTSHYPYSEQMMRLAMEYGIVVIDEVAAVGLKLDSSAFGLGNEDYDKHHTWRDLKTFDNHVDAIHKLIKRDKNNPAVVMGVIANEPDSKLEGSVEYFKPLYDLTKELDLQKRPVSIVSNFVAPQGHPYIDVVCLNRYYGWYVTPGDLTQAEIDLRRELTEWKDMAPNKPVMITEYGVDTIPGMHDIYDVMFTEEYQSKFHKMYHRVFDEFDYFIGEHIWNFADFEVWPTLTRVQGNKKGIFTRERRPKSVASEIKQRWDSIPDFNYKKDKS